MACSIDSIDVSTKGWSFKSVTGLLDFPGAKETEYKTEETTSVNEVFGKRYKMSTTVELTLLGSFESVLLFEMAVLWLTGMLIQAGSHTFVIESETLTGQMVEGLIVKQAFGNAPYLEIESEDFGKQKVVGEVTIKIQRNG